MAAAAEGVNVNRLASKEANALLNPEVVWQDRMLCFDTVAKNLQCRRGEFEIDSINSVEDTKGNNGDRGYLIVTNLRNFCFVMF